MSEPQTPAATGTPAAQTTPAAVAAPATTAPVGAPPATTDDQNPPWLKGRLEQAKAAALAEIGITDPAKAKEAIAAAAKAEEDAKSQGQKLGETSKALEAANAEKARLANVVKDHAALSLSRLSDADRDRVRKLAPDTDPAEQLRIIDVMFPSSTAPAAVTTTPATPATTPATPAKTTPAPAASTAPAPTAPPGGTVSTPDHKAVHAQLAKTNPFAAANYALEHLSEVFPEPTQ